MITLATVERPHSARRVAAFLRTGSIAAAVTLTAGLPMVAFTRLMLFHFYTRGSFVLDSGLFAALMWHSDLALTQPASAGGGSFLAVHFTPLFLPISALSRLLPFSMAQFFAGFIGASHALLALSVFWMVLAADRQRRPMMPWLAALAGLAFAFSGLSIMIVRYPHFEPLIPAFFLLFATAIASARSYLAYTFLACGLLVREDAGLHYMAVFVLVAALNLLRGQAWRAQRRLLGVSLACLLASTAAMAAQRIAFSQHASSFVLTYLGDPPLAHLTWARIGHGLLYVLINRPYVILPASVAFLWAWLARAPFVAIGYVACLPWLALQLLAASPFASAWASYYVFPCLIGMAWPLLAMLNRQAGATGLARPLAGYAVMIALSFVPGLDIHDPGRLPVLQAFLQVPPSRSQEAATERAVAAISAARPGLGRLWVDNSVAALDPDGFTASEIDATPGFEGHRVIGTPETVAYFVDGFDAVRLAGIVESSALQHRYAIPGTPLHIASARSLADLPELSALIVPEKGAQ